ncbi:MAG: TetR family transcriptional regulator [Pseudonocardiaceae bacterium]|nr:TetR family transcriptional regulator [Pseudonocardiaceae bacterium]
MPATQQERSRNTREALLSAGRRLFGERGYPHVAADEIVAAAGVTRGALYHHYDGKHGLFRAVLERLEGEITADVRGAVDAAPDVVAGALAGVGAFLDTCQRPEVLRIALTDAPAVLGWSTWRAIEAEHGLGLITELLERASAGGAITVERVDVFAQLLLSALIEAALLIANATDVERTRQDVESSLGTLLSGLLVDNG